MERKIYDIGNLKYFRTVFFGKHRQIIKETIEWKDEKGQTTSESHSCDYIITLGKKAIVITEVNPKKSAVRLPFVVKPWKRVGKLITSGQKINSYIDIDGHIWNHLKDNAGEMISYYNGDDHEEDEPTKFANGETKFFHFEVHPAYT